MLIKQFYSEIFNYSYIGFFKEIHNFSLINSGKLLPIKEVMFILFDNQGIIVNISKSCAKFMGLTH